MSHLDMCNGIRNVDCRGDKAREDHESLREEYEEAVACLAKCECIIAELVEQLESKDDVIGGLEERMVRMSLELANSKACDQQLESKDERIASLEGKVAEMEAKIVRMSLELASSKAFEDEHRAKKKVASVVDFEGGSNDDDDEDEDEDMDSKPSESIERPSRPRAKAARPPPRRAASMDSDVSGMLREWNRDPIPHYPDRNYPSSSNSDWAAEAAPARIDNLLRRAASMDARPSPGSGRDAPAAAQRRPSLWSVSTGHSASDGSFDVDSRCSASVTASMTLDDVSTCNSSVSHVGVSGGSVFDRVAARGSSLLRRTLSRERLVQVKEAKDDDEANGGSSGDGDRGNVGGDGRRRPSARRPPSSFRSTAGSSQLRSSSRRMFLEQQGVVFPRSFEEVLAKGGLDLSDSLRDSLRGSFRGSHDMGGRLRGSAGSGGRGRDLRGSLRGSLRDVSSAADARRLYGARGPEGRSSAAY